MPAPEDLLAAAVSQTGFGDLGSASFREPVTPTFESRMRQWWETNSANREPRSHGDPADLGLDLEHVRPLFADYVARARGWTARRP